MSGQNPSLPNRDTVIAILLLLLCGLFIWASFDIRQPDYGILGPAAWPRAVLAVLTFFCLIYLFQSLRAGPGAKGDSEAAGLRGWFSRYRNPLWCYGIYLAFLVTLPYLGALIGGIALVFALLTVLGGFKPRQLLLHAVVASLSMGAMWALFTFGLRVILPQGEILSIY